MFDQPRRSDQPRRFAVLFAALFVVVLLGGCKGDAVVTVDARHNGSGVVRVDVNLDAEATKAMGDPAAALSTASLEREGWNVSGLTRTATGAGKFSLARTFVDVGGANAILDELTGTTGPFHGLRLARSRSLTSSGLALRGTVDLTKGLESFGDALLAQTTGSTSALGFDSSSVEARYGTPIEKMLSITLVGSLNDTSKTWPLPTGTATQISLASTRFAWEAAAGIGAIVLGLAGLLIALKR